MGIAILLGACLLGLGSGPTVGCGPAETDKPPGLVLRPGDSLLRFVEDMRVTRHPNTGLPPDVALSGSRHATASSLDIATDSWRRAQALPEQYQSLMGLIEATSVWESSQPIHLDASAGRVRLEHEGRALPPSPRPDPFPKLDRNLRWWDATGEVFFFWDYSERKLLAVSQNSPGQVRMQAPARTATDQAASASIPADRPTAAAELVHRVADGQTTRPCLVTPADSRLELDIQAFGGDGLSLSVALSEHAYRSREGAVEILASPGASLRVALEARDAAGRTHRLWEQTLDAGLGFEDVEIPLADIGPGPLTLALITDARASESPATDTEIGLTVPHHYVLWSGLQVTGPVAVPATRPHIVIIDIDTLRADRLGSYGAERPTSPRLDAWAEQQAVVYSDTTSPSNWTLPSTVSMLTGLAVHQHGVESFPQAVTTAARPLAQVLSAAGYETRAIAEGGFVGPMFGLDLGFDEFSSGPYHQPDWAPALEWIEGRSSERPFFLFLHTYMVHAPLAHDHRFEDPKAPYAGPLLGRPIDHENLAVPERKGEIQLDQDDRQYVRRLYDAGIVRMDSYVGDFLEQLDALLGDAPRLVIITSDHGEEFWEHDDLGHGQSLYGEQLRVPLIVRFPDGSRRGTAPTAVSTLDIVPTVRDVAGLPPDPRLPGMSLLQSLPLNRLRVASHPTHGHAVELEGSKLIRGPAPGAWQVFDLANDAGEQADLAANDASVGERLSRMLDHYLARWPPLQHSVESQAGIDPETLRELRALGYLGDG